MFFKGSKVISVRVDKVYGEHEHVELHLQEVSAHCSVHTSLLFDKNVFDRDQVWEQGWSSSLISLC